MPTYPFLLRSKYSNNWSEGKFILCNQVKRYSLEETFVENGKSSKPANYPSIKLMVVYSYGVKFIDLNISFSKSYKNRPFLFNIYNKSSFDIYEF